MTESNECLLVEKKDFVCTLMLNRPEKRNSLSPELLIRLTDTLNTLSKDDNIRTIIIRGVGDKAFCAGYDIGALNFDRSENSGQMTDQSNPFETAMETIVNYPYPVIAMVNGYAFGGGCDLAASCDIRIGAADIKIGMVPAKLGVVYSLDGLRRFVDVVGFSNAKDLFFTGNTFAAKQLKEMGFLNYLVAKEELESFTMNLAQGISTNAPLSLKGIKRNLNILSKAIQIGETEYEEGGKLVRKSFLSQDFKEGQTAFFEKRAPHFEGR
ncbi:MAG: enoyl-CoA hydratase [Deltaproteobacteria bacterium]|nr:enoyl-CoA hydratase [Deltaproteobacteria bacterium]MBT4642808.1 enoyl-CoA hydratase [Deltaproteobacteria bacterium]MBT6499309.1 enoyl-CoA hydratase [Deltaproteobacteria bacterium]MBT6612383.1 enoyl-CoA hydratase [Deltaproteobacteria bacterium]MBT7155606.1 enoyl-CoA hydratase [Deltaproteobacteria bacterium]